MLKPLHPFQTAQFLMLCPICHKLLTIQKINYCYHCGVALDTSEENENYVESLQKTEEERHAKELERIEKLRKELNK